MKLILSTLTLAVFFTLNLAHATDIRVQRVRTLGAMNHKVIFQSKDLKQVRGTNYLAGKLVVQWGTEVFEVVKGIYACNRNLSCRMVDYKHVASFRQCIVKGSKVACRGQFSGRAYNEGPRSDVVVAENPDAVEDEFGGRGHRNDSYDRYDEFPARVGGEYDDIQF